jgi:hypothetical protein
MSASRELSPDHVCRGRTSAGIRVHAHAAMGCIFDKDIDRNRKVPYRFIGAVANETAMSAIEPGTWEGGGPEDEWPRFSSHLTASKGRSEDSEDGLTSTTYTIYLQP